jgi:hypothetical protein
VGAAVAGELDDSPLRRALENLGFSLDPDDSCNAERAIEHPPRTVHLLAQASLVERRAEKPAWSASDVDEHKWCSQLGGKDDRLLNGGATCRRFVDGCNDRRERFAAFGGRRAAAWYGNYGAH